MRQREDPYRPASTGALACTYASCETIGVPKAFTARPRLGMASLERCVGLAEYARIQSFLTAGAIFTCANFTFDPRANAFICPGGKQLRSAGLVREEGTVTYLARTKGLPRLCPQTI